MTVEFDAKDGYWSDPRGMVGFLARVEGRLKPCWIETPALEDLVEAEENDLNRFDYVAIFGRCRAVIEAAAADKFRRGLTEPDDGGVIVHTDDLTVEHGKHGRYRKILPGGWGNHQTGSITPGH
jgi:hypothetical protein